MIKTLRVSLSNLGDRLQDSFAQRDEGQRDKPLGSTMVNELQRLQWI